MSVFKQTPGVAGILFRSIPEAKISYPFSDLGIVSRDAYYPQSFVDDFGVSFEAMTDFQCSYTGMFFEFKSGYLNGLKSCDSAQKAKRRFNQAKLDGYIHTGNAAIKSLECSWSASVPKFRMVQEQTAAAGGVVVMVFDKLPDEKTVGRLTRSKAFWCVFGDATWRAFMSFRICAKYGWRSEFNINGHIFTSAGGILH